MRINSAKRGMGWECGTGDFGGKTPRGEVFCEVKELGRQEGQRSASGHGNVPFVKPPK